KRLGWPRAQWNCTILTSTRSSFESAVQSGSPLSCAVTVRGVPGLTSPKGPAASLAVRVTRLVEFASSGLRKILVASPLRRRKTDGEQKFNAFVVATVN